MLLVLPARPFVSGVRTDEGTYGTIVHRRDWLKGAVAWGSAGLIGCSAEREALAIGVHPWPGYESLFLAEQFGWIPTAVQLHKGRRAGDSLAALAEGSLDGAAITLDEMMRARTEGLPLVAALVFNDSIGADAVLVRPEVREWSHLVGRRVAVEHSGTGELVLSKLLELSGLRRDQLKVLDIPPDDQVRAWQEGRIDAAVTYEPVASRLTGLGARRLLDSSAFPDLILDVLAVRRDRVAGCDETLRGLVASHFRALEHLRVSPDDALRRIAAWRGTTVEAVRRSFSGLELPGLERNHAYLSGAAPKLARTAATVNRVLVAGGLVARGDDLKDLADGRWLPTAPVGDLR